MYSLLFMKSILIVTVLVMKIGVIGVCRSCRIRPLSICTSSRSLLRLIGLIVPSIMHAPTISMPTYTLSIVSDSLILAYVIISLMLKATVYI